MGRNRRKQTEDFDIFKRKQLEQLVRDGNGLLVPDDARECIRGAVNMDQEYFMGLGPFYIVRLNDPEAGVSIKLAAYNGNTIGKSYELSDEVIKNCLPGRAEKSVKYGLCGSKLEVPRELVDDMNKLMDDALINPHQGKAFREVTRLIGCTETLGQKLQDVYEEFAGQVYSFIDEGEPESTALVREIILLAKWKALDIRDATPKGESAYDVFEQIRICEGELT